VCMSKEKECIINFMKPLEKDFFVNQVSLTGESLVSFDAIKQIPTAKCLAMGGVFMLLLCGVAEFVPHG
jgi:hypothetical protein